MKWYLTLSSQSSGNSTEPLRKSLNPERPVYAPSLKIVVVLDAPHREKFFTGLAQDPSLKVKLTGSWETLIGPVDNFGSDVVSSEWLAIADIRCSSQFTS